MEGDNLLAHSNTPRWAVPLLALGLVAAVLAFLASAVAAGLVFPLLDLTPLVVLSVAWIARRWDVRSSRWFGVASVLSTVMIAQWIAWDLWLVRTVSVATPYAADRLLGPAVNSWSRLYLIEVAALLAVFATATVLASLAIRRQRTAMSQE